MHGALTDAKLPFLLAQRNGCDLYFDSGDCVKSGNLAVPIGQEAVWDKLRQARCDASVPGNRESHPLRAAFEAKIQGHAHPLLVANMAFKSDGSPALLASMVKEVQGTKIGIVGTMVAMVTERMATKAASHYLWSSPIPAAIEEGKRLRPAVDLLVCLSHIGFNQDKILAESTTDFDIIFGGHSHTVLMNPERVGSTWICQGGSHCRFVGKYSWQGGALTGGLVPWE